MSSPTAKCVVVCICVFVLGILFGIAIDARYRPNHIKFEVESYTKVNLTPREGDVIEWAAAGSDAGDMQVNFLGRSPCNEPNGSSTCTINKKNGTNKFIYHCVATKDKSYTCFDPGVGPITTSGTGGGLEDRLWFGELLRIIKLDLVRLFSSSSTQAPKPELHQVSTGGPVTPANASAGAVASGAKVGLPILTPLIYCTDPQTVVVDPNQNPAPVDTPIQASVGQIIGWSSPDTFALTLPPICKEAASPMDKCTVTSGTVGTTYTYTVRDYACPGTGPKNEQITIVTP